MSLKTSIKTTLLRALTYLKAEIRYWRSGRLKATIDEQFKRLEICYQCDCYDEQVKSCILCGCPVYQKTLRACECCPKKEPAWLAIANSIAG